MRWCHPWVAGRSVPNAALVGQSPHRYPGNRQVVLGTPGKWLGPTIRESPAFRYGECQTLSSLPVRRHAFKPRPRPRRALYTSRRSDCHRPSQPRTTCSTREWKGPPTPHEFFPWEYAMKRKPPPGLRHRYWMPEELFPQRCA